MVNGQHFEAFEDFVTFIALAFLLSATISAFVGLAFGGCCASSLRSIEIPVFDAEAIGLSKKKKRDKAEEKER